MKPIGVFYATREGQTRKIAEHIAADLRARGLEADLKDLRHPGGNVALTNYSAVLLAASAHMGRHEHEIVNFVQQHASQLRTLPAAFISVSLSEAGVERTSATPEQHAQFATAVDDILNKFFEETHWHPEHVKPVAGALQYSKYNRLKRFMMKRIAGATGAETDTSHDYEYTDWAALDHFVRQFVPAETIAAQAP